MANTNKRKAKETTTADRGKRPRFESDGESGDNEIDEGRAESENMLRNSHSANKNKTEKEWHVVVKEQIRHEKTDLLKQLEGKKKKIAAQKKRKNEAIRSLIFEINPSIVEPSMTKSHDRNNSNEQPLNQNANLINTHATIDDHIRSLLDRTTLLVRTSAKIKTTYASTSSLIKNATFPPSITATISEDRERLLATLEHGRRVAVADIKCLTSTPAARTESKVKRGRKGNAEDTEGEVEDAGMQKWRRLQSCLRADAGDQQGTDNVKKGEGEKGMLDLLIDARKGVEKIVRGLPQVNEVDGTSLE